MTLPRISDILKILYPNSLDFVQQHHLDRGTRLHKAMEDYCAVLLSEEGGEIDMPEETLPVLRWVNETNVVFQSAEELVEHRWGFCGHPDLLCSIIGIDYWVDWKFSETITEQNRMQGTAYCYLTGRKGLFVQCPHNGKVKAVQCKRDPHLWAGFLAGLGVKKFHLSRGAEKWAESKVY